MVVGQTVHNWMGRTSRASTNSMSPTNSGPPTWCARSLQNTASRCPGARRRRARRHSRSHGHQHRRSSSESCASMPPVRSRSLVKWGNLMRDSGTKGTMLLLSSVAAKEARVDYLPYNASKIAVLHIMWSMAKILGPAGISVNAVNPGPVNTPLWSQLADQSGSAQAARGAPRRSTAHAALRRAGRSSQRHQLPHGPVNRYITGVSLDVAGGAHLGMGS